jgi:hypothetical protein
VFSSAYKTTSVFDFGQVGASASEQVFSSAFECFRVGTSVFDRVQVFSTVGKCV